MGPQGQEPGASVCVCVGGGGCLSSEYPSSVTGIEGLGLEAI